LHQCNTGKELRKLVKESIQTYNDKRPHLTLNMKTPNFIHNKKSYGASSIGFI
ncbi:MAG: integrase core domain-containing protein, partial [Bacteroidota bacterium]